MTAFGRVRVLLCAVLAAAALLFLVATLADIGVLGGQSAAGYLLKSRAGVVCLYRLPNRREPVLVSPVRADSLAPGLQRELASGVAAADYAQALALLRQMGG